MTSIIPRARGGVRVLRVLSSETVTIRRPNGSMAMRTTERVLMSNGTEITQTREEVVEYEDPSTVRRLITGGRDPALCQATIGNTRRACPHKHKPNSRWCGKHFNKYHET